MMFMVVRTLSTPPKLQPVYPKGPGVQLAGTWCFGKSNRSASSGEYISIGQNSSHPAMDADMGGVASQCSYRFTEFGGNQHQD